MAARDESHANFDSLLGRRQWFGSAAAMAAGAAVLNDVARGADNPAENVADRASTIAIKSLRALPAGAKCYVKIETNHGITGWGEITGLQPKVAANLAESLFELLDGQNPTRIEHLWQKIYRSHRDMRGGPFMVHTLSAIDMALWDITGKLWGVPVYRLLGGPCREKIRIYPTPKAQKTRHRRPASVFRRRRTRSTGLSNRSKRPGNELVRTAW